jgi:hypothetical protein
MHEPNSPKELMKNQMFHLNVEMPECTASKVDWTGVVVYPCNLSTWEVKVEG